MVLHDNDKQNIKMLISKQVVGLKKLIALWNTVKLSKSGI